MVKAIVGQMARHSQKLSDTERGLIDRAVNAVWSDHGVAATITGVGEALAAQGNEAAADLATDRSAQRWLGPVWYLKLVAGHATLPDPR